MAGRPKFEITDEILRKVEALAAQGLSQEQIASCIGCSLATISRRKLDNEKFDAAIKNGNAKGIATVTNALFQNAKGGNLGAQIFYLKNRAGWRDKQEVEQSGPGGGPIQVESTLSEDQALQLLKKHDIK